MRSRGRYVLFSYPHSLYHRLDISILFRCRMSHHFRYIKYFTQLYESTLTFAAMDTTSTALSRTLHLLSQDQRVQGKLRSELLEAKERSGGEDLSFDELMGLEYLDAVVRETLRMSVVFYSFRSPMRRIDNWV